MTANGDVITPEAVAKSLQRHLNCLQDDNKVVRRRGLQELQKETIKKCLGGSLLQSLVIQVLKPAIKLIGDPSESTRESAVKFTADYLHALPSPEDTLHLLMPVLVQRLGTGESIVEPSEEVRLQIMSDIIVTVVELCGVKVAGFISELQMILVRTILDPYAEVRKLSCRVTSSIARTTPQYFHMQSAAYIKPLMMSITHQHSKVLVLVIFKSLAPLKIAADPGLCC